MSVLVLALAMAVNGLWVSPSRALDRPLARPPHAGERGFESDENGAGRADVPLPKASSEPAYTCPDTRAALRMPPAWDRELARQWVRVALEHRGALEHALRPRVHNFCRPAVTEELAAVFESDAEEARAVALDLRRRADGLDPGLMSLFALTYVGREQQSLGGRRNRAVSRPPPAYATLATDLSRRLLVDMARFELERLPAAADWIDDPKSLYEHRNEAAPAVRRIGFEVHDRIRHDPEFVACVAAARTSSDVAHDELRPQVEIIGKNAGALDAFLRYFGIDLDATLKAFARTRPGGSAGTERTASGVAHDRLNRVAFLDARPTTVAIHTDTTSRDPNQDFAALVWQWEDGCLGDVTGAQMEALVQAARPDVGPGPFAEVLDATILDLRTRYALEDPTSDWSRPRVSRWERSIVSRNDYNTFYELQLDTRGSYAVPVTDVFATKRLGSPVGMLLAVSLQGRNLPQTAMKAFSRSPAALHLAVIPDRGVAVDVFTHPRALSRRPGVERAGSWNTPATAPPAAGWEIQPFGPATQTADDSVLLDVRPLPDVAPGEPRSFRIHACLLAPLDVRADGRTVRFASPIWRSAADIPSTARFLLYRRETRGGNKGPWTEVAGTPLGVEPELGYPYGKVSRIRTGSRDGYVEFAIDDHDARADRAYEYRVVHRCALKPYADDETEAGNALLVGTTAQQ